MNIFSAYAAFSTHVSRLLKDALRCLKHLSMYLQSNKANVVDAFSHFNSTRQKLLALKEVNHKSLSKFCDSSVADKQFKAGFY